MSSTSGHWFVLFSMHWSFCFWPNRHLDTNGRERRRGGRRGCDVPHGRPISWAKLERLWKEVDQKVKERSWRTGEPMWQKIPSQLRRGPPSFYRQLQTTAELGTLGAGEACCGECQGQTRREKHWGARQSHALKLVMGGPGNLEAFSRTTHNTLDGLVSTRTGDCSASSRLSGKTQEGGNLLKIWWDLWLTWPNSYSQTNKEAEGDLCISQPRKNRGSGRL